MTGGACPDNLTRPPCPQSACIGRDDAFAPVHSRNSAAPGVLTCWGLNRVDSPKFARWLRTVAPPSRHNDRPDRRDELGALSGWGQRVKGRCTRPLQPRPTHSTCRVAILSSWPASRLTRDGWERVLAIRHGHRGHETQALAVILPVRLSLAEIRPPPAF